METELRILLVEDAVNDADIIEHDLRKINLAFCLRRVETQEEFIEALRDFAPDLIFSDYSLPDFNGLTALRLARDLAPKVPFILITGALDEEMAVDCIKAGAADFVLKGHLSRLGLAVMGALEWRKVQIEKERLEEELRQAQKMEAIGRLAGGIAHDFNNLLTAITGYSTLLLEEMPDQDPRRPDVLEIKDAADRACGLTRQLLAFSRKQVLQPKIIDLNKLVTRLSNMLQRLIGEDIELRTLLDANLGRVQADPGQIEQVVMNLAVNARDAMANGGHLTIETANVELDDGHLRLPVGVPPGRYVRLMVRDSGCGMDQETQAHLFEPFFTTKQPGKGTGLGLSTAYGIVKQSGGDIQVESVVGVGTAFRIYLPRVMEPAAARSLSPSLTAAPSGSETVLLVEDDDGVRALLLRLLRQHGYRVLEAQRAGEALVLSEQHSNPIHILVTDLVMPQMNGRELAEQLVRRRPDLRILYMSGYTDDSVIRKGILDQNLPFLQKPFAPGAFLRKVRELLGASPT